MPVTSLWRVTGDVAAVIDYTTDEQKTEYTITSSDEAAAEAMEHQSGTDGEICVGDLHAVTDYAMRGNATVWQDAAGVPHRLVSGINCDPELAVEQMRAVKKRFGKTGGTVAYHGYQSFADGEGPPDLIHQIGVETAKRLWGDRYQVLVTTHVDHEHHLHNHFVLNTVSFSDGKKFYRSAKDYHELRRVSDELAREFGFYVIEKPERRPVRDYTPGRTSWRKIIKADVDAVIAQARTEEHFYSLLRSKGYELKTNGKDISVRAPGAQRFLRLERNFGASYSRQAIRRQIVERWMPRTKPQTKRQFRYRGNFSKTKTHHRKLCGIQAIYIRYCYLLGIIPAKRRRSSSRVSPALKKELLHLEQLSAQTRLLCKHHISTPEELAKYQDDVAEQICTLAERRTVLNRQQRTVAVRNDPEQFQRNLEELSVLSTEIYRLRREKRLCDGVQERCAEIAQNVRRENQQQMEQQRADQQRSRRSGMLFRR